MRFRLGLLTGFTAGYYLGAKAGQQRYQQIQRLLNKAKDSDLVETATEKAKAVMDLGVERAKDLVERGPRNANGEDEATPLVVEVPVPGGNGPP